MPQNHPAISPPPCWGVFCNLTQEGETMRAPISRHHQSQADALQQAAQAYTTIATMVLRERLLDEHDARCFRISGCIWHRTSALRPPEDELAESLRGTFAYYLPHRQIYPFLLKGSDGDWVLLTKRLPDKEEDLMDEVVQLRGKGNLVTLRYNPRANMFLEVAPRQRGDKDHHGIRAKELFATAMETAR